MIRLHLANEQTDWARLYAWRNEPVTRAQFKMTDRVPLDEHLAWLKKMIDDPDVQLFIADDSEAGLAGVGTCRLDLVKHKDEDWAECSIAVDACVRGRGYAVQILDAMLAEVSEGNWRKTRLIQGVLATIKTDNYASLRAFASCGFRIVKVTEKMATLEYAL